MKTLTHTTQIIKVTFLSAFLFLFITASALANNDKTEKDATSKTEVVEEESEKLAQEIMADFDEAALDLLIEFKDENTFQVMDQNDQVIFSGNEKAWNDQNNKKLVIDKRKVELLFELNGAKIYKVF